MDDLDEILKTPFKAYIAVNEDRLEDGTIVPRVITWEDGRRYEIDKVIEIRRAASLRAGGTGLKFLIIVEGKPTFLWLEDTCNGGSRYFVERRRPKSTH